MSTTRKRMRGVVQIGLLVGVLWTILVAVYRWKTSCTHMLAVGGREYAECLQKRKAKPDMFCYVSLLCDDVMIDAALVMLRSFQKTQSVFPFVLFVLPGVTETDALEKMGARIVPISGLEYPAMFKVTKASKQVNKMCRYSKLEIWRLTEFKKAIFVDIDTLFRKNTDDAFQYNEIAAVSDLGDTFNTGFFLFQPSLKTHGEMVSTYETTDSYNQGDQGFINTFFSGKKTKRLGVEFNTIARLKEFSKWEKAKESARLFHYTSETKPWNFHHLGHSFFREYIDVAFYYEWVDLHFDVQKKLSRGVFSDNGPKWDNFKRRKSVCDRTIHLCPQMMRDNARLWVSVVVHAWETPHTLDTALSGLRIMAPHIVDRIFVLWSSSVEPSYGVLSKYAELNKLGEFPEVH
ncbi:MAG: glycosyl transferase, partial [Amphiamblys sp. WSBS2006]